MNIPTQQDKRDGSPGTGGENVGNGLLANPSPGELKQAGDEEGEEDQGQGLHGHAYRQRP